MRAMKTDSYKSHPRSDFGSSFIVLPALLDCHPTLPSKVHRILSPIMHQQVITVFGATGRQGGSVVKTFLEDRKLKGWLIRGVTRNAFSEKARDLAAKGVEVVEVTPQ